jgi:hypothetical protein
MATELFGIEQILNPKHEIRAKHPAGINSKQSQMTKFQIFKTEDLKI